MLHFILVMLLASARCDNNGFTPMLQYENMEEVQLPVGDLNEAYLGYIKNMVMMPTVAQKQEKSEVKRMGKQDFDSNTSPSQFYNAAQLFGLKPFEVQTLAPEKFQSTVNALTSIQPNLQMLQNNIVPMATYTSPITTAYQQQNQNLHNQMMNSFQQQNQMMNSFVPSTITIQGIAANGAQPQNIQYKFVLDLPPMQNQKEVEIKLPPPKIITEYDGNFQNNVRNKPEPETKASSLSTTYENTHDMETESLKQNNLAQGGKPVKSKNEFQRRPEKTRSRNNNHNYEENRPRPTPKTKPRRENQQKYPKFEDEPIFSNEYEQDIFESYSTLPREVTKRHKKPNFHMEEMAKPNWNEKPSFHNDFSLHNHNSMSFDEFKAYGKPEFFADDFVVPQRENYRKGRSQQFQGHRENFGRRPINEFNENRRPHFHQKRKTPPKREIKLPETYVFKIMKH